MAILGEKLYSDHVTLPSCWNLEEGIVGVGMWGAGRYFAEGGNYWWEGAVGGRRVGSEKLIAGWELGGGKLIRGWDQKQLLGWEKFGNIIIYLLFCTLNY